MNESESFKKIDLELVKRAQAGDRDAYSQLVERHYGLAYSLAWAVFPNAETAEDLSQEVFLRGWLHLDKLRDPEKFVSWIGQMTRNLARDWMRKGNSRSRIREMIEKDIEINDQQMIQPKVTTKLEEEDHQKLVEKALSSLSPDERELLLLHFQQGLSQRTIAQNLGVHHTTIGRKMEKALQTARKMLKGDAADLFRESSPKPRPGAAHSAVALVAASTMLSHSAKASVVEATASGAISALKTPSAVGWFAMVLEFMRNSAFFGGVTAGTAKVAVTTLLVGATLTGFVVVSNNQSNRSTTTKSAQYEGMRSSIAQTYSLSKGELNFVMQRTEAVRVELGENFFGIDAVEFHGQDDGGILVVDYFVNDTHESGPMPPNIYASEGSLEHWTWGYQDNGERELWGYISAFAIETEQGIKFSVVHNQSSSMFAVTQHGFPAYFQGNISKSQAGELFRSGFENSGILPKTPKHREALLQDTAKWIN